MFNTYLPVKYKHISIYLLISLLFILNSIANDYLTELGVFKEETSVQAFSAALSMRGGGEGTPSVILVQPHNVHYHPGSLS